MTENIFKKRTRRERPQNVLEIPVAAISPNPAQPRRKFTDDALLRLADSIRRHGIIQPLSVRVQGEGYLLIAGERRLRAARLIGLSAVPCVIIDADERDAAELAIIENIQREDLNMFEEAEAIASLIELHGLTQEKVAASLSCSQSYVANKLRLRRLSPEDRDTITEHSLTERHARALLRISDANLRTAVLRRIIADSLNVLASEELIDSVLSPDSPTLAALKGPSLPLQAQDSPPPASAQKTEHALAQRLKFSLKDIKMFYNSIDHAIELVRAAGVPASLTRREHPELTEITISVPTK